MERERELRRAGWRLVGATSRQHWHWTALSLTAALAWTATKVTIPLLAAAAIDQGIIDGDTTKLVEYIGLMVVVGLFQALVSGLRRYGAFRLAYRVETDLRQQLFTHLQRLHFAFHDEAQTGQLMARASTDIQMVREFLMLAPLTAASFMILVAIAIIMLSKSVALAFLALGALPLLNVAATRFSRRMGPISFELQQELADLSGVVEESVSGIRVVKGFGAEKMQLRRLQTETDAVQDRALAASKLRAGFLPLIDFLPVVALVMILWYGGHLVIDGKLQIGALVAFNSYILMLVVPLRMSGMMVAMASRMSASAGRVHEVLATDPKVADPPRGRSLPEGGGDVRFDAVRFAYYDGAPVLDGLDLHVRAGEAVALVGATASGKSTVARLIPRFYDVDAGSVSIDSVDVRTVRLADLRAAVGIVFEDTFLFSDTVRANIAFADSSATMEAVRRAARLSGAADFIEDLPDGYETLIGEHGFSLSGGQRQRIAIAVAVLADPRILILDDATSAVDPTKEHEIRAALREVMAGRTTIIIAHRPATIALADRVFLLDEGRIVAEGTHQELVATSERYRDVLADAGTPDPDVHAGEAAMRGGGVGGWARAHVTDEQLSRDEKQRVLRRLWRMLVPYRALIALAVGLLMVQTVCLLAGPMLVRRGIDQGLGGANGLHAADPAALNQSAALYLGVALLAFALGRFSIMTVARVGEAFLRDLRIRVFRHLMDLGLDYFEREQTGRLVARMTADVDAMQELIQLGLTSFVQNILLFTGAVIAIFLLSWQLALCTVVLLPPLIIGTRYFRRAADRAYLEVRERIGHNLATLQEGLAGVRVVQAFGQESSFSSRFEGTNEAQHDANVETARVTVRYFPFVEYLGVLGIALIVGIGGWFTDIGIVTVGTVAAFVLYLNNLFEPVQQLSQIYNSVQSAGAALNKLFALLDTPPSIAERPGAVDLPEQGSVVVDNVSFAYGSGKELVLREASLEIGVGERLALVGPTGAGKSTLAKLIARFYDPVEGSVRLGGVDLRDATLRSLRERVVVVPQEGYLFTGTIRDNVRVGRPDATDSEVDDALRELDLLDRFKALPEGLDTEVRERGSRLSAGERQLVSLARAALADPSVLVLDEATSNLDPGTERAVELALEQLTEHRTVIVVAHRLSTAARADRVAVIDAGRLVELGTHDELVSRDGRYSKLFASWSASSVRL